MSAIDLVKSLQILEDIFESKDVIESVKIPLPSNVVSTLVYCRDTLQLVVNRGIIDRTGVTFVATEAIHKIESILNAESQNG